MKKTTVLGWGFGVSLALSAFGCGTKADDDAAPVPLDQLPQQFAQAYCDGVAPCCGKQAIPYTSVECRGNATEFFTNVATANSNAKVKYDADAAGRCLQSLKHLLSSCAYFYPGNLFDDACQGVFTGTLSNGATCSDDVTCASGHCVDGACAAAPGDAPHGAEGDACYRTCDLSGGRINCTDAIGELGTAACYLSDGLGCPIDFRSLGDPSLPPAVCTKLAELGEPCMETGCVKGAFCDFVVGVDAPVCQERRDSGPCELREACTADSYCDGIPLDPTGAQIGAGQGECKPRKPDGYSCQNRNECKTFNCNGGTEAHPTCGLGSVANSNTCSGDL